jgi:hypothetical protein
LELRANGVVLKQSRSCGIFTIAGRTLCTNQYFSVKTSLDLDRAFGIEEIQKIIPHATEADVDAWLAADAASIQEANMLARLPEIGQYAVTTQEDFYQLLSVDGDTARCVDADGNEYEEEIIEIINQIDYERATFSWDRPVPPTFVFAGHVYTIGVSPDSWAVWSKSSMVGRLGFGGRGWRVTWPDGRTVTTFNLLRGSETDEPNTATLKELSNAGIQLEWQRRELKREVA